MEEFEEITFTEQHNKLYKGERFLSVIVSENKRISNFKHGICKVTVNKESLSTFFNPKHFSNGHGSYFEWGYVGSLPANLSYSIIYDFLGYDYSIPPSHGMLYSVRRFQQDKVKNFLREGWEMTGEQLFEYLDQIGNEYEEYYH